MCIIFQQKRLPCYILLTDQISLSDCLYYPVFDVTDFEIKDFKLKIFQALKLLKLEKKFKYLKNKKRLMHFSSFLKGFQLPEIVSELESAFK